MPLSPWSDIGGLEMLAKTSGTTIAFGGGRFDRQSGLKTQPTYITELISPDQLTNDLADVVLIWCPRVYVVLSYFSRSQCKIKIQY